eukprot:jgi/Picre1/33802/NNA_001281.t1
MGSLVYRTSFRSVNGCHVKEGLCYGKPEAFALTLVIPALLLLHLFGAGSTEGVEMSLDVVACVLLTVFALRKYTQDVVDDIGMEVCFDFKKCRMKSSKQCCSN